MSLRRYFKTKHGLPDPRGLLSESLGSRAVQSVNREVEKALEAKSKSRNAGKKRGPYMK